MIILTLLLLEGMAFMLGHILGREEAKKGKNQKEKRPSEKQTELKNFFSYDGSIQE